MEGGQPELEAVLSGVVVERWRKALMYCGMPVYDKQLDQPWEGVLSRVMRFGVVLIGHCGGTLAIIAWRSVVDRGAFALVALALLLLLQQLGHALVYLAACDAWRLQRSDLSTALRCGLEENKLWMPYVGTPYFVAISVLMVILTAAGAIAWWRLVRALTVLPLVVSAMLSFELDIHMGHRKLRAVRKTLDELEVSSTATDARDAFDRVRAHCTTVSKQWGLAIAVLLGCDGLTLVAEGFLTLAHPSALHDEMLHKVLYDVAFLAITISLILVFNKKSDALPAYLGRKLFADQGVTCLRKLELLAHVKHNPLEFYVPLDIPLTTTGALGALAFLASSLAANLWSKRGAE